MASAAAMMLAFTMGSCGGDEPINYIEPDEPSKNVNHFFICLGQSNMEGNAQPIEKDKTCPANFQSYVCFAGEYNGQSYKVGDIRTATPPLCRAGQAGGIGVTDYFGRTLAQYVPKGDNVRVAVVALGGTAIDGFLEEYRENYIKGAANWLQVYYACYDNKPYDRLIAVAKQAIANGDKLEGILFHQGETDGYSPEWNKKVAQVYSNICNDLKVKNIPFIAGQVTSNGNKCIKNIPQFISNAYVIPSDGCQNDKKGENGTVAPGSDNSIHFNHAGYETLGKRYADKVAEILGLK